jgi:hypothetical protein
MSKSLTTTLLQKRGVDLDSSDGQWIQQFLDNLQSQINIYAYGRPATHTQIGYMAGLFDLDREDRLEVLTMFLGWQPISDHSDEVSSRDSRITISMASFIINFLLNDGHYGKIIYILKYEWASDKCKARVAERRVIKAEKELERTRAKQERKDRRAAKASAKLRKCQPASSV